MFILLSISKEQTAVVVNYGGPNDFECGAPGLNLGHRMMTSSNGNIFRVTGPLCGNPPVTCGFPSQRPVSRSFYIFIDLCLNKRLSKQSIRMWFEMPSCPLWRDCNECPRTSRFWAVSRLDVHNKFRDGYIMVTFSLNVRPIGWNRSKFAGEISRAFATFPELWINHFFMTCLLSRSHHIPVFAWGLYLPREY